MTFAPIDQRTANPALSARIMACVFTQEFTMDLAVRISCVVISLPVIGVVGYAAVLTLIALI